MEPQPDKLVVSRQRVSTRSARLVLRGLGYGALVGFATMVALSIFALDYRYTRSMRQLLDNLLLDLLLAGAIGTLASIPGAITGLLLAAMVALLGRWSRLQRVVAVLVGALLGALWGWILMVFLLMFNPEADLSLPVLLGEIGLGELVLLGFPIVGGVFLGWLMSRPIRKSYGPL